MTTFKRSIQACGLSQSEAAEFFGVSLQSIKDWCRGRSVPKHGVWEMLSNLYSDIMDSADYGAHVMDAEGVRPEAFYNIESDMDGNDLPNSATREMAGAVALLIAISEKNLEQGDANGK